LGLWSQHYADADRSVYQRGKGVRQEVMHGHDGDAGVLAQVEQVAVAGEGSQ
jgi:hypothetical protein